MEPPAIAWREILNVVGLFFAMGIGISMIGNGVVFMLLGNRIKDKGETAATVLQAINLSIAEIKTDVKSLFMRTDSKMCETHKEKLELLEKRVDSHESRLNSMDGK